MYYSVGEYRHYTICRFCFSDKLRPVINLGYVPLAGGFIKSTKLFDQEKFYPLEISFCQNCFLLQSVNVIDKHTLFKDYFYHSSAIKTLKNHFSDLADELLKKTQNRTKPLIVEIGCNDGALLKQLTNKDVTVLGVDPATNIVASLIKKGLPIMNDFFSEKSAKKLKQQYGKADIICSFNALAHIEDMHDILKGIKMLLKNKGMLIFETHYLGNLLEEMQYDMIYHEHQYYYSLMTLKKFFSQHDMEIFDIKPVKIHAGSMRYYVQRKGIRPISQQVKALLKKEKELHYDKLQTYLSYNEKVAKTKRDLLTLLNDLKKNKKTIAGYGASGRGTILMNYCGLTDKYLDYDIDDAPAKQGKYTPGNHLLIKSSDILTSKARPDYVLLFAWSFWDEIREKNQAYLKKGGKFIIPLPKVSILPSPSRERVRVRGK